METMADPLPHYETIIPDALANLIIIEAISFLDLTAILTKLQEVKGDSLKTVVMFFKTYCALPWLDFRSITLQEHTNIM